MMPSSSIETHSAGNRVEGTGTTTHAAGKSLIWRELALALSIAHLSFIQAWHGLLFERSFGYFNRIPVNRASLGALLINVFGFGVGLWFLGRWVKRLNQPALRLVANLMVCGLVLVPLNFVRTHYWNLTGGKFTATLREPLLIVAALVGVFTIIWFHRYAARAFVGLYVVLSPMLLFTAGKCMWLVVNPPAESRQVIAPNTQPAATNARVIWILLDELDQRLAFEARPARVGAPELTRLYLESFHATNAFPPGGSTMYSLPALTTGREVRAAHPISDRDLLLNGTNHWSKVENVFSRARSLGVSTALIGWYHPYRRVLGKYLDRCEWYSYPPFEEERGWTLVEALLNQICAVASQFQQRRLHLRMFQAAEAASLNLLTNSAGGLTLLHLPVPHHPGIYDPARDKLTAWKYGRSAEYFDNITLADRLFGRFRRVMEQAGAWENTWIIVSSDHWWREASVYDGKIDHRVPLIVKGPGRNDPIVYGKSLNTVVTHDLILSMLKGELTAATQLAGFLDKYQIPVPPGYEANGAPK